MEYSKKSTALKNIRDLCRKGKIVQARKYMEEYKDLYEEDAASVFADAKVTFYEGKMEEAGRLLEQTIELPCIIGVFNSKLSKYDKNNEKYKIYIEDESPENQSYMSSMCFKTKSELQIFKNKEFSDKIEIFRNAKKSYEYLK